MDLYAATFAPPRFRERHSEWPPALPHDGPPDPIRILLYPGHSVVVETGVAVRIPDGREAEVRPRSGLAFNAGVVTFLPIGTIDSSYRGTISVLLWNQSGDPVPFSVGDRVAQLIFSPVDRATLVLEPVRPEETSRGANGFGSTDRLTKPPLRCSDPSCNSIRREMPCPGCHREPVI